MLMRCNNGSRELFQYFTTLTEKVDNLVPCSARLGRVERKGGKKVRINIQEALEYLECGRRCCKQLRPSRYSLSS